MNLERKSKDYRFLFLLKGGDLVSLSMMFLVKAWKPLSFLFFLSCGDAPLPLNVLQQLDDRTNRIVHYTSGVWIYQSGERIDAQVVNGELVFKCNGLYFYKYSACLDSFKDGGRDLNKLKGDL